MKINRMEFLSAIKFLHPALGNNDRRKNLMYLHVEVSEKGCVLTAADSFLIKRVSFLPTEEKGYPEKHDFLIHRDHVKEFRTICNLHKGDRKQKYSGTIELEPAFFQSNQTKIEFVQPHLKYPNLERIISPKGEPSSSIGMGIHAIGRAIKDFPNQTKMSVIKITNYGDCAPYIFESQCGFYKSVLMPVKIQW